MIFGNASEKVHLNRRATHFSYITVIWSSKWSTIVLARHAIKQKKI